MSTTLQQDFLRRVLAQLPDQEFYSVEDLRTALLPPDLRHFLTQALTRRATLESNDLVVRSSPWIDFQAHGIEEAIARLTSDLSRAARYPRADLERMLPKAIDTCTRFAIDPAATLAEFVFRSPGTSSTSISDLRRRAEYFLYFTNVSSWLNEFLADSSKSKLLESTLKAYLKDRRITEQAAFDASAWITTLEPVYSMFEFVYPDRNGVPVEVLRTVFEHSAAEEILAKCEALQSDGEELITTDHLRSSLENFFNPPKAKFAHNDTVENSSDLPLWKQFAPGSAHSAPPAEDSNPSAPETEQSEPLWKTYQQEPDRQEQDPSMDHIQKPEPARETHAPSSVEPATTPDAQNSSASEQTAPQGSFSSQTAERVLGAAHDRKPEFVAQLFNNDEDAFHRTLERLESSADWDEAASILWSDVFKKYQIDIYTESAVQFTNAIESYVKQFN